MTQVKNLGRFSLSFSLRPGIVTVALRVIRRSWSHGSRFPKTWITVKKLQISMTNQHEIQEPNYKASFRESHFFFIAWKDMKKLENAILWKTGKIRCTDILREHTSRTGNKHYTWFLWVLYAFDPPGYHSSRKYLLVWSVEEDSIWKQKHGIYQVCNSNRLAWELTVLNWIPIICYSLVFQADFAWVLH